MKAAQIQMVHLPDVEIEIIVAILHWQWSELQNDLNSAETDEELERVRDVERLMESVNKDAEAAYSRVANKRQLREWARYARSWSDTPETACLWAEIYYIFKKEMSNFEFRQGCYSLEKSLRSALKQ